MAEIRSQREPETQLFRISFKYYNDSECQISLLEKNNARRMLSDMRIIGKCTNIRSLRDNNIGIEPVYNSGAYRSLFNHLSPDIEMKEHIIQATARVFYFIVDSSFNVVAIKNSHTRIDKNR